MDAKGNENLLTIREVCELLHCHPNTLRKWDKMGLLTAMRIGNRSDRRYRKNDVLKFLEEKPKTRETKSATQFHSNEEIQKRFSSIVVNQSPASIIITDTNGNIEYVNPKFTSLTGYTAEEVKGKNSRILKSGHTKPEEYELLWKTITAGKEWRGEFLNKKKNGELYWEMVSISTIKNNQGEITHYLALKEDITKRKKAEEDLRESEAHYRSLFENMLNGFAYCRMIYDDRGIPIDFIYCRTNRAFAKLTKLRNVVGKKVTEVIQGIKESNPELFEIYGRVALTGKPETFETEVKPLGIWFSISVYSPKKKYFIAIFDNITKRKELEMTLKKSEERYKTLVEASPDCIKLFDKEGKLVYINNAGLKEHQLKSREEIKTWDFLSCIAGEDLTKVKEAFNKAVRGQENTIEVRHTPNGSLREVCLLTLAPKINEKNEVEYIFGVSRDISILKRTEGNLRESERRFRLMADGSPMIIWVTDSFGHLQFVNKTYRDFFGVTLEQIKDDKWQAVVHLEDMTEYVGRFKDSFSKQKPFSAQARVRRADGEWRWIESRAEPRFSSQGKFLGYIGVSPDITERKRIEQRKDEFLSIASHELKTPVTSIKGYGQILQHLLKQNVQGGSLTILTKLDFQINKLTTLVNDLLDVTRIQAGKLQLREELFDFTALVNEVVEDMQRTTQQHKIIKKLGKATKTVYGDRNRIEQVLINLIANAIKYSPATDKIIVSANTDKERVIFSVKDFGLGIPKDSQEKIFERYYRASSIDENAIAGLGLGLYISNEIIKRQQGKIWFESATGKGSTFFFSLPLQKQKSQEQSTLNTGSVL